MSHPKHTPEPWRLGKFEPFGMYLPDNTSTDVIGSIYGNDETGSRGPSTVVGSMVDKPNMANARLIAAAPELLALVKNCFEYLSSESAFPDGLPPGAPSVERFEAAIAKATGGE